LVAAAGEVAALVHLDDVARPLQDPLDAPLAPRLVVPVVDGGDEHLLAADGDAGFLGADFQAASVRVEVGEVAAAGRLGVGAGDVAGGQPVGEVAGVLGAAEAAGGQPAQQGDQRGAAESDPGTRHGRSPSVGPRPDGAAGGRYTANRGDCARGAWDTP